MSEILAIGEYGNNANMIAAAAELGFIEGEVLDCTFGEGKFWSRFQPEDLVTNDVRKAADLHYDCRSFPFDDDWCDTVVFDPPYKLAGRRGDGGRTVGDLTMDARYGTERYMPVAEVMGLLRDGTTEACRLSRKWVLVKCQDQVCGSRIHWQTDHVTNAAAAGGFWKAAELHLRRKRAQTKRTRKGPDGKRVPSPQLNPRMNYSTLLIFERRKPPTYLRRAA